MDDNDTGRIMRKAKGKQGSKIGETPKDLDERDGQYLGTSAELRELLVLVDELVNSVPDPRHGERQFNGGLGVYKED